MIKVDAFDYGVESDTVYFDVSCKYAINKIPQLAMGLQRERDGGMVPQGIWRGVSQTPRANRVRPDVNGGTHETLSTFLSSVLNHSFLPEVG